MDVIILANNQNKACLDIDGLVQKIRPNTRIIKIEKNLGYPAAVNVGVSLVDTPLVGVIDDDVQICSGWLGAHLNVHRSYPDVAVTGSRLLDPETGRIWSTVQGIAGFTISHPFRDRPADHPSLVGHMEVQSVCSAAMVINRENWQDIGGLDERLSLFFSDPDFCVRSRSNGKAIYAAFEAHAYHSGSGSVWNRSSGREDQKAYYFAKNKDQQYSDISKYADLQFMEFIRCNRLMDKYTVVDVSTITDVERYIYPISHHSDIINTYKFTVSNRDLADISIFKTIGYSLGQLETPILYFCDRYYALKNNHVWKMLRQGRGDLVVDRHANIIDLGSIVPGGA
jgi:GT2 family glycosyltransferase